MQITRNIKLVMALGATAAILAVPAWGAPGKASETAAATPQISVSGTGTVTATPDIAIWTFGVTSRAAGAREALRANGVEMRKVNAALKAAGIAAADIRTMQVYLSTRTNQDGTAVIGYEASNSVVVKVRKAASTGEIVDAAVEAGADGVSGPAFQVSGQQGLYRQALDAAFADAKAKAQRLAQSAGLTLGKAIAISEQGSSQPIFFSRESVKAAAADSTPVEAGSSELQASVTVTFALS